MTKFIKLTTLIFALLLPALKAAATPIEDGQTLAKQYCAKCHSIDEKSQSTKKAAPPFRTFSEKWPLESLEEALAEGIMVGHDEMPEFKFNPDQIANFIAFLASLNNKGSKESK